MLDIFNWCLCTNRLKVLSWETTLWQRLDVLIDGMYGLMMLGRIGYTLFLEIVIKKYNQFSTNYSSRSSSIQGISLYFLFDILTYLDHILQLCRQ